MQSDPEEQIPFGPRQAKASCAMTDLSGSVSARHDLLVCAIIRSGVLTRGRMSA